MCLLTTPANPLYIEMGYGLTKAQGRVMLVGVPRKGKEISIYSLPLHFGKVLTGSHGGDGEPHLDIPRYHNLFRLERIKLRELITDEFGLEQINDAISKMRDGIISGRCIIKL
jgi:S-(hydroxymethyl)glutathione dehydrogenase/alcohol dehydrogenase